MKELKIISVNMSTSNFANPEINPFALASSEFSQEQQPFLD